MRSLPLIFLLTIFALCGVGLATAQQATGLAYSDSASYTPRILPAKADDKGKKKKSKDPAPVVSQTPAPEQMPGSGPTVKEDSPIAIPVSVFDAHGNFVGDLKQDDFKVYVDESEAQLVSVEQRSEPINVVLVVDTSPSSAVSLDSTKQLATTLAGQFPAQDKIVVFGFNQVLKQLSPLTNDHDVIAHAISKLNMGSGTSLYDITGKLFTDLVPRLTGRTVVLLVTDGVDTTSMKMTYARALVAAEMSGATVYPVYLDTMDLARQPLSSSGIPTGILQQIVPIMGKMQTKEDIEREYAIGKFYLNDLVYLSGGRALKIKSILSGGSKISATIAEELHEQYYLTFAPTGSAYVGQRKHIQVRVDRPNLAVLARGSYIVSSPPSKTTAQK